MENNPSIVAREYRLREWTEMVRDCQNRPGNVSFKEWCIKNRITKNVYYYRLRQVRKACLDNLPSEAPVQKVVQVPANIIQEPGKQVSVLNLTFNGTCIHVTNETSPELLKMVMGVIADVK